MLRPIEEARMGNPANVTIPPADLEIFHQICFQQGFKYAVLGNCEWGQNVVMEFNDYCKYVALYHIRKGQENEDNGQM